MIIMLALNTLRLFEISSSVALMQAMAIKGAESIMMISNNYVIISLICICAISIIQFFLLFNLV